MKVESKAQARELPEPETFAQLTNNEKTNTAVKKMNL